MHHEAIGMEDYNAMDGTPLDGCLQDVASCDVYIGVFAWRYGYIPDDDDKNPNQISITELEFLKPRKISCSRFLAQALDSTALQKNTRLTYGWS